MEEKKPEKEEKARKIAEKAWNEWDPFPEKGMFKHHKELGRFLSEHLDVLNAFRMAVEKPPVMTHEEAEGLESFRPGLIEKAREILDASLKMTDEYKVAEWILRLPILDTINEVKEKLSDLEPPEEKKKEISNVELLEKLLMGADIGKSKGLSSLFEEHKKEPKVPSKVIDEVRDKVRALVSEKIIDEI